MGRIIIFGDSIAYGKWDSQGGWVARLRSWVDEKYNLSLENNLQVHNCSIPGDISIHMVGRLVSELKARIDQGQGNVVMLSVGINDSNPDNAAAGSQTTQSNFKTAFTQMIEEATKLEAKPVLVGLTPVNEEISSGKRFTNEQVKRYDAYLTEVSVDMGVGKIEILDALEETGYASELVDEVHPNDKGHEMIYKLVLKYLQENKLIDYCLED